MRNAALDAPSLAPTNSGQQLGVVVPGEQDAVRPFARQPDDQVDHVDRALRGLGDEVLLLDREAVAGDLPCDVRARLPDRGRARGSGPIATIWLRCSQALLLSNTARAGAAGQRRRRLAAWPSDLLLWPPRRLTPDIPERATDSPTIASADSHTHLGRMIIACRSPCSPASWRRCRSAAGGRSSGRGRAASRPTAPASRPCAESRTAPGTWPPGSPSPGR